MAANLGKLTGTKPAIDVAGLAAGLREFFRPDGEACANIGAGLMGADLPVPDAVTRLQNIVVSFRKASDADVVATAAATWVDLAADHEMVCKLAERLEGILPLVRKAREEVKAGAQGLPAEAGSALVELADLLAAGDLLSHGGKIKDLTAKLQDARQHAATDAAAEITARLADVRTTIRARFAEMDGAKIDEALRLLDDLAPAGDPMAAPVADLLTRVELVETRAANAARLLEELQAAGNLARVHVARVVTEPITTEEELGVALDRIRQAVVAELADGKQVRLQ